MASTSVIKWKQHPKNLTKGSKDFWENGTLTDTVIVCGKRRFNCHRALLSASSEFLKLILQDHPPWVEPVVVVENVEETFMEAIIHYLYTGIITIDAMKAGNFLQVCSFFKIKGLLAYDLHSNDDQELEEERATISTVEIVQNDVPQSTITEAVGQADIHTKRSDQQQQIVEQEEDELIETQEGGEEEEVYDEPEPEDLLVFLRSQPESSTPLATKQKEVVTEMDTFVEVIPQGQAEAIEVDQEEDDEEFVQYFPDQSTGNIRVRRVTKHQQQPTPPHQPPRTTTRAPATAREPTRFAERKPRSLNKYTEDQLNKSMEAVCNGDINLSSASLKFNVPKSVLWRKLQKRTDYVAHKVDKRREAAKEALLKGESIEHVCKKYDVPRATLYRDKQKLVEEGHIEGKHRSKLEVQDALQQAIQACAEGMAQSEAARLFQVSKSTLWRKIKKGEEVCLIEVTEDSDE